MRGLKPEPIPAKAGIQKRVYASYDSSAADAEGLGPGFRRGGAGYT